MYNNYMFMDTYMLPSIMAPCDLFTGKKSEFGAKDYLVFTDTIDLHS